MPLALDFPLPELLPLHGYRMAYREWGTAARGRTIVLLHGITGSSLSRVRVAPALVRRYHVVAVDLKGQTRTRRQGIC